MLQFQVEQLIRKLENNTKKYKKLLLLMFPVNLAVGLGYQLDVLLGVSLRKGGLLPEQTGPYLRDSFRVNSLIPARERIQEELEDLHSSNHWEIVVIIFLALWRILGKIFKKRAEARGGLPPAWICIAAINNP